MCKKFFILFSVIMFYWTIFAQTPNVFSTLPVQNMLNVAVDADISVTFDANMNALTINDSTFIVNTCYCGFLVGAISFDSTSNTAIFEPNINFIPGDRVSVVLTTGIKSNAGVPSVL